MSNSFDIITSGVILSGGQIAVLFIAKKSNKKTNEEAGG
jgi:hypothetical protein